jgi:hypothetical protein
MNQPVRREGFVTIGEELPQAAPSAAAKPAPAPAPAETWPIKVKLMHKAIRDPSEPEDIRELSFRQPTAGDINRCGNPCRIDGNGDLQVDERKMTLIMGQLSGVLSPILEQMDARDWATCRWRLQSFFLPDWEQVFQVKKTT